MFKKLEGDQVLLKMKGVFKPADIFTWNGGLYANHSGGYIRLKANSTTSKDGVEFVQLVTDTPLFQDSFGRITVDQGKPLALLDSGQILIPAT